MEIQIPGDRIRAFRQKAGFTMRELAEVCNPPMDFSAIGRIENNQGYTSSTLGRLAKALGCEVHDFFLSEGLSGYTQLSETQKEVVHALIKDLLMTADVESLAES